MDRFLRVSRFWCKSLLYLWGVIALSIIVIVFWPCVTHAAFGYYSPLTIQAGQVPSAQTDFPILISVTDARLKTVANGGHVEDAQGDDIRPYTDSGLTTAITGYEKVFYSATTGQLEMWVKRSSVADGLITYLAYGDAAITTDGSSTTTWSAGFLGVYHLGDGTTLNVNSATGTHNGTNTNGVTATSGQIDGAGGFASASSQYVDLGAGFTNTGAATVSAWVNATSFANAYEGIVVQNNGTNQVLLDVKSNGKLAVYMSATTSRSYDGTGSHTLSTATWYYLTATYDSSAGLVGYVNAASDGTASANGTLTMSAVANFHIGNDPGAAGRYWNGKIDEARVANAARTANWITTEYNNQVAPGTFMVLGTEVPVGAPATNTGAFLQFYP